MEPAPATSAEPLPPAEPIGGITVSSPLSDETAAKNLKELEAEIRELGNAIRNLKDKLKAKEPCSAGLDRGAEERGLKANIDRLVMLKLALPRGHPLRPEEREKEVQKQREVRRSERPPAHRVLGPDELAHHRVQRKIHNVFASSNKELNDSNEADDDVIEDEDEANNSGGEDGNNGGEERPAAASETRFRLNPALFNVSKTGLDFCSSTVIATEKWDGTTLQADRRGIFKRRDLIPRGDPRKFNAGETERYALVQINISHPSNRHLRSAIGAHLPTLERSIPEGITLYFEAVGPRIQPRFRDAFGSQEKGTIRVFDAALNGQFLRFSETIRIASELNLPVVHWFEYASPSRLKTPEDVLQMLRGLKETNATYTNGNLLVEVPLEGYVFRCAEDPNKIAKLRVCDLEPLLGSE